jgi:hypothetical protein
VCVRDRHSIMLGLLLLVVLVPSVDQYFPAPYSTIVLLIASSIIVLVASFATALPFRQHPVNHCFGLFSDTNPIHTWNGPQSMMPHDLAALAIVALPHLWVGSFW